MMGSMTTLRSSLWLVGSYKVVKRGATTWMPRWAQHQCPAMDADSFVDVINVIVLVEMGTQADPKVVRWSITKFVPNRVQVQRFFV